MDLAIDVQPANDPPHQIGEEQTAKEQRQNGNQIEFGVVAVKPTAAESTAMIQDSAANA